MDDESAGKPDITDKRDMPDMTVSQAADELGVSPRQVHRYIDRGALPFHWVNGPRGREKRIPAPAVAALHGQRDAIDDRDASDMSATTDKQDMADKRDMSVMSESRNDLSALVDHPVVRVLIDVAVDRAVVPLANELAAAREERAALQAEREDLSRRNAHLHDLTSRQAEELGRLRSAVEQAKAERIAASMHATQMIDEERAREAARPWWAFWRRPGPAE